MRIVSLTVVSTYCIYLLLMYLDYIIGFYLKLLSFAYIFCFYLLHISFASILYFHLYAAIFPFYLFASMLLMPVIGLICCPDWLSEWMTEWMFKWMLCKATPGIVNDDSHVCWAVSLTTHRPNLHTTHTCEERQGGRGEERGYVHQNGRKTER